jgi:uncharacterized protein
MSQHLPDHFDPWRFTDLGKRISGSYPLESLPRLRESLVDTQGEVGFTLVFFRGEQHRACVRGKVEATLVLQCQRCLEAMPWPVQSSVSLAFVEGIDEAEILPDALDPVVVEDGLVRLRDLVEDELLLALPQVPMHPLGACGSQVGAETSPRGIEPVRESPFAVLSELKRNDK